jgi:hypothetical protein
MFPVGCLHEQAMVCALDDALRFIESKILYFLHVQPTRFIRD